MDFLVLHFEVLRSVLGEEMAPCKSHRDLENKNDQMTSGASAGQIRQHYQPL